MKKFFYQDRYAKEHISKVMKVVENDGLKGFIFEETIFFPGGGGQISDTGEVKIYEDNETLKKFPIIKTEELDGHIVHYTEKDIPDDYTGKTAYMNINWERREDGMHQHTGQHLLSGCFYDLFGRNTTGLHIGQDVSQLDIEGEFDDRMVAEVEKMANDKIYQSIKIKNYVIDEKNIDEVRTRRPLPRTCEPIRVLEIENIDINACCGVHCLNTRDLGIIKIKRYYKHKNGTRFEYLAGKRAADYLLGRDYVFGRVLNRFNCNEDNIENAITNLENRKDEFYEKYRYASDLAVESLGEQLIENADENMNGIRVVSRVFRNSKNRFMEDLAKHLTEKYRSVVIFFNIMQDDVKIIMQTSRTVPSEYEYINLGKIMKENSEKLGIKGGGSKFMAQGKMENEKNIDIFLNNIYSIICIKK